MSKEASNPEIEEYIGEITGAYIDHLQHRDRDHLVGQVETILAGHSYASAYEKICLEQAVAMVTERILTNVDGLIGGASGNLGHRLHRGETMEVLMQAVARVPKFFPAVNQGLMHFARQIQTDSSIDPASGYVFLGLKPLLAYPELKAGLQHYTIAAADALDERGRMYNLPELLETLAGTPHADLIQARHIGAYLGQDIWCAADVPELYRTAHVWRMIEEQEPAMFCARAPKLPKFIDQETDYYTLGYERDSGRMLIDFRTAFANNITAPDQVGTRWVDSVGADKLSDFYIILMHAAEVLQGQRYGEMTQHPGWLDKQTRHLLPVLMADIPALVDRMKDEKIAVPAVIPTVGPDTGRGANSAVWNAHKRFMQGGP